MTSYSTEICNLKNDNLIFPIKGNTQFLRNQIFNKMKKYYSQKTIYRHL